MKCVVTGAAGFIGSHLCEALAEKGHDVLGLDAFIPYYPCAVKERNLNGPASHTRFQFQALDLRRDPLENVLAGADVIYHLAAMPGLVQSWSDFEGYWSCNVLATQRLLEAVRRADLRLQRFIYASTSSVYGKFASGDEGVPTKPISPYGVTKLAAEHLCRAHAEAGNLPLVVLRYFSVYGPRQRPDMAYHKFIRALCLGEPITVCGDGQQVRGNTFIRDCVEATVRSMNALPGETYNVGGGETATVWEIIHLLERITGCQAIIRQEAARAGDQRHTFADTTKLRTHLGWQPQITLEEGLTYQWHWLRRELERARSLAA